MDHCGGRLLLAAASVLLGATAAVSAESDDTASVQRLDALVVEGETWRSTATKTQLAPELTPGSVSQISEEALERRSADNVSQALRYTSGVTPELRGGAVTRFDLLTLRGFRVDQLAYDGLILLNNGWNLEPQIDPFALQGIEVLKGPASVLYGNQPPGGLVNLIARQPSRTPYGSLAFGSGGRNLLDVKLDVAGALGDSPLSYRVVSRARQRDGQAVTSEEERYLFAPSVDWQISDRTLLNLNLYLQHDPKGGIYNTVPARGSVYSNPNGQLERDAYAGDNAYNTFDREVTMPGYKFLHEFRDGWSFLQNARFLDAEVYQENTYNTGLEDDDRTLGRRAYRTDEESDGFTVDNQFSGIFALAGMQHHLLLGIDYQRLDSDVLYQDTVIDPIDLYDPDHYAIDPRNVRYDVASMDQVRDEFDLRSLMDYGRLLSSKFNIEYEQRGVYVQDQIRAGRLVLIAGGRYDRYEYREQGRKYGAEVDDDFDQTAFTGRAGVLYELPVGASPYLSYSESFEPLGGVTRNGEELQPSEARQWEAGVKFANRDGRHGGNLAVFEIVKDNVPTRDPDGGPNDVIQAGEIRSRGVELELYAQPLTDLSLALTGSWLDVEVTRDTTELEGKTPVWVAEQTAALWANYFFSQGAAAGLDLGLGLRFQGETHLDALNTDIVPSYTLIDLSLSYDLSWRYPALAGLTLALTATNLSDQEYYSCFDANNCWFGEERTIDVGLRYDF